MNLRRQKAPDSLEMLLDTMCNTFGGIILLAILVVLLTRHERQALAGYTSESLELLQRRVSIAETNLEASAELLQSLERKASAPEREAVMALLARRGELRERIAEVENEIARTTAAVDAANAADPAERLKVLEKQLTDGEHRRSQQQNSLTAARQNVTRLRQRLVELKLQAGATINASIRNLRLPKEYTTGKRPLYVILKYGRVYPCMGADLARNHTSINWSSDADRSVARPIPGRGYSPSDTGALKAFFGNLPRDIYIAFLVFEDSFAEFNQVKEAAASSSVAFGWEPFSNVQAPISFGPTGYKPKPQ